MPRLYDDLAWVWDLMVADADYESEAGLVADLLARHVRSDGRDLLDVCCGAGHHDEFLQDRFAVTGVDASPRMLELARRRNPGVRYEVGDMRAFRLDGHFDAVVILDAIIYNTTYADLERTLANCADHLKPGGCLLFFLEEAYSLTSHFRLPEPAVATFVGDDVEVTEVETAHDLDPDDTHYEHTFVYIIRRGRELTVESDTHLLGVYDLDQVEAILDRLGLETFVHRWPFAGDGGVGQGPLFVCRRP